MKTKLLIICLLASINCFAQKDYCKDIKKTVKELENTTTINSPLNTWSSNYIYITRTIKPPIEVSQLFIVMQSSYSNYSAHGVYFKLSDGSIIKDENARVNCSYVGGNSYLIVGVLELDEDMIQQLSKNTIVKYSMISTEKLYKEKEGDKMMHYFQCIFSDVLAKL